MVSLAGCVDSSTPSPVPTASDTETSSPPSATPTPSETTPAASAMPASCHALISDIELEQIVGLPVKLVPWEESNNPPGSLPTDHLPEDVARETAATATERLDCLWWLRDSSGHWSLPLHVLRLDDTSKVSLIGALDASELYEPTNVSGYPAFVRSYENEVSGMSLSYVFVEDLWLISNTPTRPPLLEQIMQLVVDRVAASA